MSILRSLKRNVAKERMKMMGYTHVNKRLVDYWRDLSAPEGAPDYAKRLKDRATNQKKKTKEETE